MKRWTVYCKAPTDGRGTYSEEVDVEASNPTAAKRAAQAILDSDYGAGVRASRVVERPKGYTIY